MLIVPREKEIRDIFQQMLDSESGEEKELLKKEFFKQFMEKRKDSPADESLLGEYMVRAAEANDEEIFDWLLNLADRMRILVELNRKYVYKIVERFGIGNHTWEAQNKSMGWKIPGIYAAIINGDVELVRYYMEHGVSLQPDHTEEFLLYGGSEGIVPAVRMNENYPAF